MLRNIEQVKTLDEIPGSVYRDPIDLRRETILPTGTKTVQTYPDQAVNVMPAASQVLPASDVNLSWPVLIVAGLALYFILKR